MAEPYVERGGRPWVAWIIILVIIAFIIWLFVAFWGGSSQTVGTRGGPGGANAPAAGPGGAAPGPAGVTQGNAGNANQPQGAITDLDQLTGAENKQALEGRQVSLNSVQVNRIEGKGFWAGSGDNSVFVLLPDGVKVQAGQNVSIGGAVQQVPANQAQQWGLNAQDAAHVQQQGFYIHAQTVGAPGSQGQQQPR